MTAEEAIIDFVNKMPDDASAPDIAARLYLRTLIDSRTREVEAGDWVEHVDARKRLSKWFIASNPNSSQFC